MSLKRKRTMYRKSMFLLLMCFVATTMLVAGCGDGAETPEEPKKPTPATKPAPVVTPPVVTPPVVTPPVVTPPVVTPPVVTPPVATQPVVKPPVVTPPVAADRILDGKKAQKLEIRHSMIGFRNTLLFYTFKDQQAVLTLSIGNTDETFPVKGKLHLFDPATTEEGLKKWVNNQHSDGLFPDIPTPIFTGKLPEGSCTVTSHKQTGTSKNPTSPATFKNYEVKLSVKEHAIDKKAKLSAFTDTAKVHVKSK
jgi:hypothetical protein